jgi:hypothetical protein
VALKGVWTASGTGASHVTATITAAVGDVIHVVGGNGGGTAGVTVGAPTSTLAGAVVHNLQSNTAASNCAGGAWSIDGFTGGTGTVTVPQSSSTEDMSFLVIQESSATAATAVRSAKSTGSSRTASYTPSQAGSRIIYAVYDWSQGTLVAETPTSSTHNTSTPGPQAVPFTYSPLGLYSAWEDTLDAQASTGATTYGITGTGTGPYTIFVVEIQQTGAAAAIPPILVMPPRRP